MRWLLLVAFIIAQSWRAGRAEDCPYPCVCYPNQDPERTLTVDCRNQELFEIPLGIPPTTSHLDVSYNSIQFIRAVDLQNLPVLTYLQLHTNDIVDIGSGAFQELSSLDTLTLQNNMLRMLRPGTFSGLANLQTLNLFNNYIEELEPGVFSALENLVYLDLGFNSLESIRSGTFSNLSRLFDLDLSDNFIGTIEPGAISNLPFLRAMNLDRNQLQSVPPDAWVDVPFLHILSLSGNPLECGCGAVWLRQWFLERRLRRSVTCHAPSDLQGLDLLILLPADFCQLPTANIVELEPIVLSEGMTLQLTCITSGAPPPMITWSRQGMTLDLMNSRVQITGNSLVVSEVIANDSGRYFCSATSSAGTAAGSIDVAVVITENVTVPVTIATIGNTVTLECDNDLSPSVRTMWRFNSSTLDLNMTTSLNFTGRFAMGERGELIVFNVQEEDMGRYECVLAEGVSLFRDLLLQAVPVISISPVGPCETPDVLSITTGDSIRLRCMASGVPTPTVTWITPNRGSTVGQGSAVVVLSPPMVEDTGLYMCRAVNEIGEDLSNLIVSVMAVLTPGQSVFRPVNLLVGMTAILNCSIENRTTTSFVWRRSESQPLSPTSVQTADGTLIIPDVELSDIAIYVCRAEIEGGSSAEIEYGVALFDPPRITKTCPQPEPVVGIETGAVTLDCPLEGRPRPSLQWTFGNVTIESGGQFSLASRDELLTIRNLTINNSGVYTCTVENDVGIDIFSYILEVQEGLKAPFFRRQPLARTDVVEGGVARLHCQAEGEPTPSVSWFMTPLEADTPVTQILPSERVVLSPEELVVFDVQTSDEGYYFCVIENELGRMTSRLELGHLSVWVPPRLTDSLQSEFLVREGQSSIIFPCSGTGDPEPTLNWLHGSLVLPLGNKQRILPDGSLEIFQLVPEDSGEYMCRLANVAGEQYHTVNLIVRALPRTQIDPRDPSPIDVGSQLTLFCSDMGMRPDELEWLEWRRDGLRLATGGNVVVMPDTGELVLSNLQISDSGNYTCEIRSYVGSSEAFVLLSVEDPFLASGAMTTPLSVSSPTPPSQTLAAGQTAQFSCIASRPPPPVTIEWFKDGSPLRNLKRIIIDEATGGLLTISDTRITDEGEYSCQASNRLGVQESLSFSLTIATRPVITWPPEAQVVAAGQTLELRCKAFGRPEPQIIWLHNDTQLSTQGCTTINQTDYTLTVCNTTASSAGWYSCLAQNMAGSAEFSVPVTVLSETHVPPNITITPQSQTLMAGEPFFLDCIAEGIPQPIVTWFKDGVELNTTCPTVQPGACILLDESVYIQDSRETDSGTYSCVAENTAGTTTFEVQVMVEPPSMLPIFTAFPTIINQSESLIEVECLADGMPEPVLSWLTASYMNVSHDQNDRIFTVNGTLFITDPVPSDSGQYICHAENSAGINQVAITIWIGEETDGTTRLFPTEDDSEEPKFLVPPHDVATFAGLPVAIPCSTDNELFSSFTLWRRDARPLYQDDDITIATNGTLTIQRSKVEHSGEYDCLAVNEKGIAMATINIKINSRPEPPCFLSYPEDLRVDSGSDFWLPCQPDTLSNEMTDLSWLVNGEPLTALDRCGRWEVGSDGSLHVTGAQTTDSGLYTCTLSNQHATVGAMATVTITDFPINQTVTTVEGVTTLFQLVCSVGPEDVWDEPLVQWTMGREPLTPSSSIIPFGSQLLFLAVDASLQGEYTCTYQERRFNFFLEVLVYPQIETISTSTQARIDTAVRLNCSATGNPTPQIVWHHRDQQLHRGPRFSPLRDGSLYLHPPLALGLHTYTCTASNTVGEASAHTTLNVTDSILND